MVATQLQRPKSAHDGTKKWNHNKVKASSDTRVLSDGAENRENNRGTFVGFGENRREQPRNFYGFWLHIRDRVPDSLRPDLVQIGVRKSCLLSFAKICHGLPC